MESAFARKIKELQERYGVDPSLINFEITETASTEFNKSLDENLQVIKDMGYSFSLDDYGTGYSNIHRVFHLPISIVKIDKTMVDDLNDEDKKGYYIMKNSFMMLHDIHMKIVTEGVETKEVADKVIEMGCDYIQGFYYARPMDKERMMEFLSEKSV
jgi:EAL domain-containing protein (putative c-di-GMP-specific phosphodiesterase class I)